MNLFDRIAEMGHEQVVVCHDKASGYRGIIAIHDTTLGPALGGTRFWNYGSDEEAVTDALRRARASESRLDDLRSAAEEGVAVVRLSPFRRRHRGRVQEIADLVVPLDRAIRNTRVLVRRCAVSVWRDERMPDEYPMLLERLADGTRLIGESLFEPAADVAAHRVLGELGRRTAEMPLPVGLSAVVVLGQLRSTIIDLLELTGTSYDDARTLVPLRLDGLDEK